MARGKSKKDEETGEVSVELKRSQSSVEIKRDAKSVTSFVVKAYADTLEEAEKLAVATYERLMNKTITVQGGK